MNKALAVLIVVFTVGLIGTLVIGGYTLGLLNSEADLRTLIDAKHEANLSEYSNFKSKIKESAQVADKEAEAIANIVFGYANARGANGSEGGGSMIDINAVHEAVPTVDIQTLRNLQNIIVGARDNWNMRQKELTDLSAQHNKLLNRPISGMILSIFGKKKIDIKILATSQAKEDFETETETEQDLF